jgi:hypothetical protein
MMRYLCLSALFLLVLSACSEDENKQSVTAKTDFDLLCEQFTILTESAGFSSLTSEERASKLDAMLTEKLEPSSNAYIAWTAIRNGPPSERYFLYKDAAASTGYEDWTCPAAKLHGSEIGSIHD